MNISKLELLYDKHIIKAMSLVQNNEDVEALWEEVVDYFEGSISDSLKWFGRKNAAFNSKAPIEYVIEGNAEKVLNYILEAKSGLVQ